MPAIPLQAVGPRSSPQGLPCEIFLLLRFGYALYAQLLPCCRVPKARVPMKKTRARRVKRSETAEMGAGKRELIPNETRHLAVH